MRKVLGTQMASVLSKIIFTIAVAGAFSLPLSAPIHAEDENIKKIKSFQVFMESSEFPWLSALGLEQTGDSYSYRTTIQDDHILFTGATRKKSGKEKVWVAEINDDLEIVRQFNSDHRVAYAGKFENGDYLLFGAKRERRSFFSPNTYMAPVISRIDEDDKIVWTHKYKQLDGVAIGMCILDGGHFSATFISPFGSMVAVFNGGNGTVRANHRLMPDTPEEHNTYGDIAAGGCQPLGANQLVVGGNRNRSILSSWNNKPRRNCESYLYQYSPESIDIIGRKIFQTPPPRGSNCLQGNLEVSQDRTIIYGNAIWVLPTYSSPKILAFNQSLELIWVIDDDRIQEALNYDKTKNDMRCSGVMKALPSNGIVTVCWAGSNLYLVQVSKDGEIAQSFPITVPACSAPFKSMTFDFGAIEQDGFTIWGISQYPRRMSMVSQCIWKARVGY